MRLSSVIGFGVSLYLSACIQVVVAAAPNERCAFPRGLGEEISKKYPGTRLVRLEDLSKESKRLFQKDHGTRCPGLVKVDFYGDGRPTWALVLAGSEASGRKAELVLARQVGKDWEISSLDTADAAPVPVVWREGPGKYRDVYGQKTIRATRPVIVFAGYGTWAILYAWTGKEVTKIWISD